MTRRESRGLLVLIITLIALISGGIIAYKNPDSWHGLAMLVIGLIGCYLCYKRWKIATKATAAEKEAVVPAPVQETPARTCTYEEVRAVLAEKARMGYRVEVRTLITKHGAEQLSDIKDPAVYGEILTEAEELGNG